jgi:arsenate reductase-like glutaredoxin family protein
MVIVWGPGNHQAGRNSSVTRLHYSPDLVGAVDRCNYNWANVANGTTQVRQVQVFGTKKSADTRKALRFFAERRIVTHFVDFQERGPALGELRRFSERFGVSSLVDRESRRFLDLGLQRSMHSDDWWLKRLTEEPGMLKQPLVRFGHRVSVGLDENTWREWLST